MAWQDYVNDKYSRKKEQQETAGSASPSPSFSRGSADALRTLEAQVNAQRKAAAGTWQGHINQKYGQQARAQAAQAQARRDQMASQLAGMAQNRQATGTSTAARYMQENPMTAPDYERTSAIKPGAIINGMERPSGRQELPTQPIKTWQPGDRVFSAGTQQEPTTPDRRMYPSAVASDLVRPSGRQELPTQPIKTWQPGDSTFAEANPQEQGALAQLAEDAWANMRTAEEQKARQEELQKLRDGLGIVGSTVDAFANNKALQGIGKLAGQGAKAAGQGLAMLWGELNKGAAERLAGEEKRFDEQYPTIESFAEQTGAQSGLRQKIENAAKILNGMTESRSSDPDVGTISTEIDGIMDLINGFSWPEEFDEYVEAKGLPELLGRNQETARELLEARRQKNENRATSTQWNNLKQQNATSEEALQAMEAAGGAYAEAVRDYRNAVSARDDAVIQRPYDSSRTYIVNGQPMTQEQLDLFEDKTAHDYDESYNRLWRKWKEYQKEEDARRAETDMYPEQVEGELREALSKAILERDNTEYEKAEAEYNAAVDEYTAAIRNDYHDAAMGAREKTDSAGAYKRMYWASLPGYADFGENSQGGIYKRPTEEEKIGYQRVGEIMPEDMKRMDEMTDEELGIANYLYRTQGMKASEEYMAAMEPELNRRVMETKSENAREFGEKHPGWATALSPFANLANNVMSGAYVIGHDAAALGSNIANSWLGMKGVERMGLNIDPNSAAFAPAVIRDSLRQGAKNNWFRDENGNLKSGWAQLGEFFYDATASGVLDSMSNMVAFGPAGEFMMGLGAMGNALRNYIQQGVDPLSARVLAGTEGAVEIVTEHLGYDRVRNLFGASADKIMGDVLSNMISEFGEEGTGSLINSVMEFFVRGDKSEFEQAHEQHRNELLAQYQQAGMSPYKAQEMADENAMKMALGDMFKKAGAEGLAGAIGGLVSGGGSAVIGQTFNKVVEATARNDIDKMSRVYGKLADAFKANWDGETLPGMYQRQFQALYDAAANNIPMGMVQDFAGELLQGMDEATQEKIYMAGQNAVKEEAARDSELLAAQEAQEQQAVQQQTGESATIPGDSATIPQAQQNMQTVQQEETARPVETRTEDVIRQAEQIASEPVARTVDGVRQTQAQVQAEERYQGQTEEQRVQSFFADQATPGVVRLFRDKKLTHNQRGQLRMLDAWGKHYGVEIDMVDSLAGGRANGAYKGGRRIVVAMDAANNAYMQVAGHEMVHYIRAQDEDAYQVLAGMITEALKNQGANVDQMVLQRMAEYARAEQTLDNDAALEEIVSEALPTIFTDRQAVQELVDYNPTLAQKIRDFFLDFVETLRDIAFDYANDMDRDEIMNLLGESNQLVQIARTFDAALQVAGETAQARESQAREQAAGRVESTATEQAASVKGEKRYSIVRDNQGIAYVKADRQVISGDEPSKWVKQIEDYINQQIRHGNDVRFVTTDGDVLTITNKTAEKARTRNIIEMEDGTKRKATDEEFAVKLRAASHIDELAQTSTRGNKDVQDNKNHPFARDGWNYRKAYFEDFDEKRYEVTLSIGKRGDVWTVYNVGRMKEESEPSSTSGSKGQVQKQTVHDEASDSKDIKPQKNEYVNGEGKNSLKTLPNQTKFSMKQPVERVGDLVAVHNLKDAELMGTLELGGLPSPSVAIVRTDMGHNMYGENSVVLYASAIDPRADRRNKVYGQDAWTPTFPSVEWEINQDAANRAYAKLDELGRKIDNEFSSRLYMAKDAFTGDSTSETLEDSIRKAMDNYGLKAAYLEDIGQHVEVKTKTEEIKHDVNPTRAAAYEKLLAGITESSQELANMPYVDIINKYGELLDSAFPGASGSRMRTLRIIGNLLAYKAGKENGFKSEFRTVNDMDATRQAMDEAIDTAAFEKWVRNLYDGVYGMKGIRNARELFTNSGNRRSFRQLHDEYNLENIVKAMNAGGGKNATGWSFHGATGIIAAASQEFKSLKEMRDRKGQLNKVADEEYSARLKAMDQQIYNLIQKIKDETGTTYNTDGVGEVLQSVASGRLTIEAIKSGFRKDGMNLSDETAREILELYKEARDMPTGYFEAKPQRAVGLDEIAAVIVPDNTALDIDAMKQRGLNVVTYAAGNDQSRIDALNSIDQPGVRFSLKNTGDKDVDAVRVLEGINGRPTIRVYGINDNLKAQAGPAAVQQERYAAQLKAEQAAKNQERQAIDMTSREYAGMRKAAKTYGDKVLKENSSAYDRNDMRENMGLLMDEIAKNGPSESTLNEAAKLGREILERDDSFKTEYADLRKRLRSTKIKLTDTQKQEAANIAGSYGAYMRSLFGTVFLSDEGMSLDGWWEELSQQYPELFPPDTSEGDMVQVLADVRERFKPGHNNPYGETLDAAATDLGLRMHAEMLKILGDRKGAAGMREAVNELRAQYRAELTAELRRIQAEQRAAFDKVAADLKAARAAGDRTAAAEAMKAYRSNLRRVGATQAEAMARIAYRQEYEDRTAMAKAYERIHKTAESLRRMLAKPDKQKHVPTALTPDIVNVLNMIDFTRNGRETEGVRQWNESLKRIGDFIARQMDIQAGRAEEDAEHRDIWMSLCEPQVEQLKENIDLIIRNRTPVAHMNMQEITAFSSALAQIQHCINSINETWQNERHRTVDELGEATLQEMKQKRTNEAQNSDIKLIRWLDSTLNVDNLDAGSFLERLGGRNSAAYSIYQELAKGQSKAYERIREASEKVPEILGFTDENRRERTKTIRNWAKEQHTFQLPLINEEGAKLETVTLTGTQLMELYALSKRPQARMHLTTGGMRISGQNGKTGDTRTWKMTDEMLDSMVDKLSDDQKRTVDRMQAYLSSEVSGWGNEVTEQMYLMTMFGEENYWPIRIERSYKRTREQDGTVLFNALTNAGFTKATQDVVKNPIQVGDALETFSGHISDMASFSGMAMPVDDFLRWYNYAARDENGFVDYTDSVKKEIERTTGSAGIQYIQRLLDDLNGMSKKAQENSFTETLMSNYKRAAIAAKLRVVIQQPTAILRASAMINPKYFTGALNGVGKNTVQEMQEHSPLAWWKGNGNYEIGTGASMKSIITGMQDSTRDDIMEALNAPAGKADDLGWATIWQAVKKETAAEHKDLAVGSKEYWDHVAQRFEDICMSTQVVDTVLTRSAMMRSKSALQKMATAFMSEPTKNFNLMRTAIAELSDAIRRGDTRAIGAARNKALRSGAAIIAATVMNAVATALFDALKYYSPDDDKDEWGESRGFWADAGMRWVNDMLDGLNPLANIPYIKDAWELMNGGKVERMDMANVSKLVQAATKAWKFAAEGNPQHLTAWAALKPMLTGAADIMGLPVSGLVADAEFAINMLKPGALRKKREDATASGAYEALYQAMAAGDTKKAEQLMLDMKRGAGGITPKSKEEIKKGIAQLLALNDDRVRKCWEMQQAGKSGIAKIKKEIMADGFDEATVTQAIREYDTTIKNDAKKYYLLAIEKGNESKAEEFAAKLRNVGVTDEDMKSWTDPKDTEKDLEQKADYNKKNLYTAIRSSETTNADIMDIRDNILKYSTAADPKDNLASELSEEFRKEYIELVNKGRTTEAAKLKAKLLTAGAKETTIDAWIPDDRRSKMYDAIENGTENQIEKAVEAYLAVSTAKDPKTSLMSSLSSKYKDDYIGMVKTGKDRQAERLADALMAAGMKYDTIRNWNKEAWK